MFPINIYDRTPQTPEGASPFRHPGGGNAMISGADDNNFWHSHSPQIQEDRQRLVNDLNTFKPGGSSFSGGDVANFADEEIALARDMVRCTAKARRELKRAVRPSSPPPKRVPQSELKKKATDRIQGLANRLNFVGSELRLARSQKSLVRHDCWALRSLMETMLHKAKIEVCYIIRAEAISPKAADQLKRWYTRLVLPGICKTCFQRTHDHMGRTAAEFEALRQFIAGSGREKKNYHTLVEDPVYQKLVRDKSAAHAALKHASLPPWFDFSDGIDFDDDNGFLTWAEWRERIDPRNQLTEEQFETIRSDISQEEGLCRALERFHCDA